MSTSRGRVRASALSGTSWRDRSSHGDSRSSAAGRSGDMSAGRGGGSGGYRGRGGARNSARGARSSPTPAPRERTQECRHYNAHNGNDAAADDGTKAPRTSSSALGTCLQMCPRAEVLERTRTMEISRFERLPSSGALASSREDVFTLAVKKYRRAAAGQIEIDRTELRPPHVLLHTLQHLFTNVLPWSGCGFDWPTSHSSPSSPSSSLMVTERVQLDFLSLYHFLGDRVRSVRKDFTIQRIEDDSAVQALEMVVRFHLLASFRARTLLQPKLQLNDWSETLNDQQLVSALAQLQVLYQKGNNTTTEKRSGESLEDLAVSNGNQSEFVAYDILLHADDPRAVSFLLVEVPEYTRKSEPVKRALALFVALQIQDFHTFFRNFQLSSPLEKSLVLKHLPKMWTSGVQMMNKAFGKQDQFRIEEFAKWLSLPGVDTARRLCCAMNLQTEAPPAPVPEAPQVVALAASDSWEDAEVQIPPTPVVRQPPAQAAAGFIRFKVSPLNVEIDKDMVEQLLVATAQRVFLEEVRGLHSACELTLNKRPQSNK